MLIKKIWIPIHVTGYPTQQWENFMEFSHSVSPG
uniref:Uncharacterized protein n=1 Tax=Arundo donax TaxID=35708 RepID=A0A0A9GT17_ARUDO